MSRWVLLGSVIVSMVAGGWSADLYVSRNGSGADGRSWETAWGDLNRIDWNAVSPGDVIHIDGGSSGMSYSGITVGKGGTASERIRIARSTEAGHDGPIQTGHITCDYPHVTFDGGHFSNWTIHAGGGRAVNAAAGANYFQLRNISVKGSCGADWGSLFYGWADNVTIYGCEFYRSNREDQVKYLAQGGNLTIERTWFHGLRPCVPGIHADAVQVHNGAGTNITVRHCIFSDNPTDCFMMTWNGGAHMGTLIYEYNVFDGVHDAIKIDGCDKLVLHNNIFAACRSVLGGANTLIQRNNIHTGTSWNGIVNVACGDSRYCITAPGTRRFCSGEGNRQVDPMFVNPASAVGPDGLPFTEDDGYRLRQGSPAIDAGVDVGNTVDILGNAIVGAPDIGAYEYAGAPSVMMPVVSPGGGSFVGAVTVSLSCGTEQAKIRYTTDGTEPTAASTLYSEPFVITRSMTVRARAFTSDLLASPEVNASFDITVDSQAPQIVAVSCLSNQVVRVLFDEALEKGSAETVTNYRIDEDVTISDAVLAPDQKTVLLQTAPMVAGLQYTLTVQAVSDLAQPSNSIDTQAETYRYMSGIYDDFEDGGRLKWLPKTAERWALNPDRDDVSRHLNTSAYSNDGDMPGEYSVLDGTPLQDFEMEVSVRSPEPETNTDADFGVMFGYESETRFYYFLANRRPGFSQLFKVVDGRRVNIADITESMITDSGYHHIKISASSGTVTVAYDGVEKVRVSEPVPLGKVGLCSYNDEVYYDDFLLTYSDAVAASRPLSIAPDVARRGVMINPMLGQTQFTFTIDKASHVDLSVYSAAGKQVAHVLSVYMEPGTHTATWKNAAAGTGAYFYRLSRGQAVESGRIPQSAVDALSR